MNKYEFKLTPAYCLYNGTAVMEQKGSSIKFLVESTKDINLKQRLEKAFENHVNYVISQDDCPGEFLQEPKVEFFEGNRIQLKKCVSRLYENGKTKDEVMKNEKEAEDKNEAAAVILLDSIINEARNKNATDIHIEDNWVKFRIRGKLEKEISLDEEKNQELIQRIKFLAGMNVLEKRRSQDGHFAYGKEKPVFIRVSTMGIIGNNYIEEKESVVIRLLDTSRIPLGLNNLGFSESQIIKIKKLCNEKNGLIIICGPTGAGKSTTAASMLQEIKAVRNEKVKIISLEDPPEYLISGVTQVHVDEKIDNSFNEALTHVFRQDPDVLMIGEIRDEKSGQAAVRAAMTGHLVIATLHTGSASGAVLRLEDLGISRKLIVSVLRGVVVQEINHEVNETNSGNLIADVSVPKIELQEKCKEELSEYEMNGYFNHERNFLELDNNSLENESVILRKENRNYSFYRNGFNNQKKLEG